MVASLGADRSDAKPTFDDRAVILASTKMHLSIFQAQALYLREIGALPKEISEKIRGLYSSFGNIPAPTHAPTPALTPALTPAVDFSPPQPKPNTIITCNPPQKIRVLRDHIPGTQREVVARCGDHIIVYAWSQDHTEAVAYNLVNKTTGRIPRRVLEMSSNEPSDQDMICLAKEDKCKATVGHVSWKAGDYIRVWERVHGFYLNGFGFNMASGQIGKFTTAADNLESVG